MKKKIVRQQTPLLEEVSYRYLPYWPLFLLLLVPCFMLAWAWLKVKTPVYEVSATIKVKDEKKGVDDDQITESLNVLSAKSIVENEVEVIKSKRFVDGVVRDLKLYAPLYLKQRVKTVPAYEASPIIVEAQSPDNLTFKKAEKVFFKYDFNTRSVHMDGKVYPVDKFVVTNHGVLKFHRNPNFIKSEPGELYFTLVNPKIITNDIFAALDVSASSKLSSIVKIKYKDAIPKRGEDIVNKVIEKYNIATVQAKTDLAKNTLAFLDTRIARVATDLNELEGKIQKFRSNKGVVNLTDQSRLYLQNVAMNDQKISEINTQLTVLDQVEKYVASPENTTGLVPTSLGVNDMVLSNLLEKLYDTELQYHKMRQTTAENNPALQTITTQIQTLRPSIIENIREKRNSLMASKANLDVTNSTYNSVLQTVPAKERQLLDVSRDQATKNNLYNFLLQRREQTALAYSSSISESYTIDPAEASVAPVSPNKPFTYLMALGLALIGTVGFAMYRDVLPNSVLFRNQIEKYTDTPVLGEIPFAGKVRKSVIAKNNPLLQDQFKQLIAAAGLFNKGNTKKKILITSSTNGEGKTFTSVNLAFNLAQAGKRVALVDMNLKNPQLASVFKLDNAPGVSEHLNGDARIDEIIRPSEYQNLFLVPAGEQRFNSTALFLNDETDAFLKELESRFDFIVMDSAAIHPSTDPYILSDQSDMTLFVVRHRRTPKASIKKLDESVEVKPLKNLSLVFNSVRPRGFVLRMKGFGYGAEVR